MDKLLAKRIGKVARKARVALGLTQEDTAEKIGITVEFYSRIERGTALPSLSKLITMALIFGISTDKLIGLTEDEEAQRIIKKYTVPPPEEPPDVRRLKRQIAEAAIETRRVVALIINELEKLPHAQEARKLRTRKKRKGSRDDSDE